MNITKVKLGKRLYTSDRLAGFDGGYSHDYYELWSSSLPRNGRTNSK